jgi:tetratricopeptide (TPR) repeat protein
MSRADRLLIFADQDPGNPVLLCDLLDELLAEGRSDDALARMAGATTELRALPGVRFRQARCALQRGEFAEVTELLLPLMSTEVSAGIAHDLAYAQFSLGALDDALATLSRAHAEGEDNVALALLKARILHYQQQFEQALTALSGLESASRQAEIMGLRALLLLDMGQTEQAAAVAAQALERDPDQFEAGLALGTVTLWAQQVDASQALFQNVLAHRPDSGRALLGLGQNWMLRGDVAAGRAALERATQLMPEHIGSWHALAWCQLLEGDLAGAKHSFDRAFAIDRTFGETHGGLALVHALRGERAAAEESIKRATRLDPAGNTARYAQSVLLLDEGRDAEARAIIDGILASPSASTIALPADFIYRLRDTLRPRG